MEDRMDNIDLSSALDWHKVSVVHTFERNIRFAHRLRVDTDMNDIHLASTLLLHAWSCHSPASRRLRRYWSDRRVELPRMGAGRLGSRQMRHRRGMSSSTVDTRICCRRPCYVNRCIWYIYQIPVLPQWRIDWHSRLGRMEWVLVTTNYLRKRSKEMKFRSKGSEWRIYLGTKGSIDAVRRRAGHISELGMRSRHREIRLCSTNTVDIRRTKFLRWNKRTRPIDIVSATKAGSDPYLTSIYFRRHTGDTRFRFVSTRRYSSSYRTVVDKDCKHTKGSPCGDQ